MFTKLTKQDCFTPQGQHNGHALRLLLRDAYVDLTEMLQTMGQQLHSLTGFWLIYTPDWGVSNRIVCWADQFLTYVSTDFPNRQTPGSLWGDENCHHSLKRRWKLPSFTQVCKFISNRLHATCGGGQMVLRHGIHFDFNSEFYRAQ